MCPMEHAKKYYTSVKKTVPFYNLQNNQPYAWIFAYYFRIERLLVFLLLCFVITLSVANIWFQFNTHKIPDSGHGQPQAFQILDSVI